eukprot:250374-Amorphochlora_amoeboformis.AAC.1
MARRRSNPGTYPRQGWQTLPQPAIFRDRWDGRGNGGLELLKGMLVTLRSLRLSIISLSNPSSCMNIEGCRYVET